MDLKEHAAFGPTTRRHPWELARARLVQALLADAPLGRVLDVGAGDGWLARTLTAEHGAGVEVTAFDANYTDDDLRRFAAPGITLVRALPGGAYDTALLLDVLEHVDDDDAMLRMVASRLVVGGRMLVSVPAWPWLFGARDRALDHRRRYVPSVLRAQIQAAGFSVHSSGGAFHVPLAGRAVQLALQRLGRAAKAGLEPPGALLAQVLDAELRLEGAMSLAALRVGVPLPGLSWFALCRRAA